MARTLREKIRSLDGAPIIFGQIIKPCGCGSSRSPNINGEVAYSVTLCPQHQPTLRPGAPGGHLRDLDNTNQYVILMLEMGMNVNLDMEISVGGL